MNHPDRESCEILAEVWKIILSGLGIEKVETGQMANPVLQGENSPQAPHRMGGEKDGRRIFSKLTVLENLQMGAYPERGNYGLSLGKVYALFPILEERKNQYGGTLSGGEQQMLAIGRALMAAPDILLLDEPSLGLAPIMVSKIFKTIQQISSEGITILLVEQNAHVALKLSHRGYVIESGQIALSGKSQELLNNEKVKHAYLGE